MLDAADVLVHAAGHPVVGAGIDHRGRVGRAVAHVVPGAVDEGVHRVGLAPRRLAAGWAGAAQERLVLRQRAAAAIGHQVLGQDHRQIGLGHRDHAAGLAVDQRDRRAPVALAADAPVAQPVVDLLVAQAKRLQVGGDGIDRRFMAEAVVAAGVHAARIGLVGVPVLPGLQRKGLPAHVDHLLDRQCVLPGEREIAFVVPGHAHHRAFAVAHQHVVADPHRHIGAGQRMPNREAGGHAFLFHRGQIGLGHAAALALIDECGQRRLTLRQPRGQRMLGRDGDEGHAHEGVGARGEDAQQTVFAVERVREAEVHTHALADPVLLHRLDLRWPLEAVEAGKQFLGVLGDAQVVAGDLALLDHRAGAPAAAVDHLLVGQHGLVDRVPVDDLRLAVGDALVEHLQEQPLVPAVVAGIAGGDLATPVECQAERLHLRLHVGDVGARPVARRDLLVDRRVLGRQAEGVPAHRRHHVEPAHAQDPVHDVVERVVAHMAHVQLAARVRQHRADVELGPWLTRRVARVFNGAIGLGGVPLRLNRGLDLLGAVLFLHGRRLARAAPAHLLRKARKYIDGPSRGRRGLGRTQAMKPRLRVVKLARLGTMVLRLPSATPNQRASVPAYWSTEVVGSRRPEPRSSLVFIAMSGNVP